MRLEFARLRAASGLSFDALASRSGLSRMVLINLEHGATRGSLETWFRVAEALGVPLSKLVKRLEDSPRDTGDIEAEKNRAPAAKKPPTGKGRPRERPTT